MSQLSVYFLGPFRVTHDHESVVVFGSDKMRALLAYLIVEKGRPHRRAALAALLWPDQADETALHSLRQALYKIRQAFDGAPGSERGGRELDSETDLHLSRLSITRQTVQFNPASDTWCDVWLFDSLLDACKAHAHPHLAHPNRCTECIARLRQATELFKGDFLQGFVVNDSREFEEWALLERETHHRRIMHALEQLADYYEEVGEHEESLSFASHRLKLEPWHEESHRQAMRLLSRTGQRLAALAQYEACRRVLAEEFGLRPARETTALYERIRDAETEPHAERPVFGTTHLSAASTPLIGREAEVTAVVEKLLHGDIRLLTVTGPGGVGKTRIALQAALDLQGHFADGAYLINLAPITDPDLVAAEIAYALGVKEMPQKTTMETIISYLQGKEALLLLDNFEQVADAAPQITRLIQSTSEVKALITSRMALGLRGTHEYPVLPMALPDRKRLPALEQLAGYEAVRLFVERAAALRPGFELTEANAAAIVDICHRLDGLPLAIELAAARIKVLPPHALLARLQSRLQLTAGKDRDVPTRQQTLRNTIEWSYDLLDEAEKQLFRRIAVFQGGHSLEALEAVCNYDEQPGADALEVVESLVSKNLLQQREGLPIKDAGEVPRFWMLETIHEYANEKLRESGERDALRRKYAIYFLELVEKAETYLTGPKQTEWLARLGEEHDNIREALRWAQECGQAAAADPGMALQAAEAAEIGMRTAGALWRFWYAYGYFSEGRQHLEASLSSRHTEDGMRAKALNSTGILAYYQSDYGAARSLHEESLAISRDLDDKQGISLSLSNLGIVAHMQGEYDAARAYYEESLAIRRVTGDKQGSASALSNLGSVAQIQGDFAAARTIHEESLALFRELGDTQGVARAFSNLGIIAQTLGDYATARSLIEEGLAIRRELGDKRGTANSLVHLGNIVYAEADYAVAGALYEESLVIFREVGSRGGVAVSLIGLGHIAHRQGDLTLARQLYTESLLITREIGARQDIAVALAGLGSLACTELQMVRGVRLLGAVEALLEGMGVVFEYVDLAEYTYGVETARTRLAEEVFALAWAEGRAMSMEQALAYATGSATGD